MNQGASCRLSLWQTLTTSSPSTKRSSAQYRPHVTALYILNLPGSQPSTNIYAVTNPRNWCSLNGGGASCYSKCTIPKVGQAIKWLLQTFCESQDSAVHLVETKWVPGGRRTHTVQQLPCGRRGEAGPATFDWNIWSWRGHLRPISQFPKWFFVAARP